MSYSWSRKKIYVNLFPRDFDVYGVEGSRRERLFVSEEIVESDFVIDVLRRIPMNHTRKRVKLNRGDVFYVSKVFE